MHRDISAGAPGDKRRWTRTYDPAMAAEPSIVPTAGPVDLAGGDARLFADRAYHELRDRIVTLRLPPGTVLREDALMSELQIGRTPLREAVKRLALENLVAVQPRRGTFVSPIEASDIVHITEVRAELEGYAAELAALRMSAETRLMAQGLLDEVEHLTRLDDQDGLMRFDERIHRFTWEASGNPFLITTLERYFTLSLRVWYLVLDRVPGLGHAVHDQVQLMEALIARNGGLARTIMREHVLAFQREIMAAFSRT
jgi:DNA-binding GntR family transcriptional regulator